jgi:uncharacterized membrane protein YdjX (TVP38/TMEM64 family)
MAEPATAASGNPGRGRAASLKKLGPVWVLLALWLLCPLLTGPTLVAKLGAVSDFLLRQPLHGVPQWTALLTAIVGLGILPAYANTIVCGWVFGWGVGFGSAMTSYLLAACISYTVARRVSFQRSAAVIESSEQAQRVQLALLRSSRSRALLVVSLFRLTGFPFAAGTLVLTSCGVTLRQNLLGTLFGMTPRIFVGTLFSAHFARSGARDVQALLQKSDSPLALFLSALSGLAILGVIAQIGHSALQKLALARAD